MKNMQNKYDYNLIFKRLYKLGYSRILIESGLNFFNFLIKNSLLNNLYIFQSNLKLSNSGYNPKNENFLKKRIKLKKKLQVYLFGESILKVGMK